MILVATVALTAALGLFRFGRHQARVDYSSATAERDRYRARLEQTREKLSELRAQLARAKSAQRIDQQANESVRDMLNRLEADNQELREQLAFYRTIVSPSQVRPGVRIQQIRIEPGAEPRRFHYKLTIIHIQEMKKRRVRARGEVELVVEGVAQGQPRSLPLSEIAAADAPALEYAIKYFKQFEGAMVLPQDFEPKYVVARIVPDEADSDGAETRIDWPAATGEGG